MYTISGFDITGPDTDAPLRLIATSGSFTGGAVRKTGPGQWVAPHVPSEDCVLTVFVASQSARVAAPSDVQATRTALCLACVPHYDPVTVACSRCSCSQAGLVSAALSRCPVGKWDPLPLQEVHALQAERTAEVDARALPVDYVPALPRLSPRPVAAAP